MFQTRESIYTYSTKWEKGYNENVNNYRFLKTCFLLKTFKDPRWGNFLHDCLHLVTLRLLHQREDNPQSSWTLEIFNLLNGISQKMSVIYKFWMLIFVMLWKHETSEIRRVTIYVKVLRCATYFYVSWRVSSLTFHVPITWQNSYMIKAWCSVQSIDDPYNPNSVEKSSGATPSITAAENLIL